MEELIRQIENKKTEIENDIYGDFENAKEFLGTDNQDMINMYMKGYKNALNIAILLVEENSNIFKN